MIQIKTNLVNKANKVEKKSLDITGSVTAPWLPTTAPCTSNTTQHHIHSWRHAENIWHLAHSFCQAIRSPAMSKHLV